MSKVYTLYKTHTLLRYREAQSNRIGIDLLHQALKQGKL